MSSGSSVPTLVRARLYRSHKLLRNVASMVRKHHVQHTLRLGSGAKRGRYTIRLSVDAGGTVTPLTRSVRIR